MDDFEDGESGGVDVVSQSIVFIAETGKRKRIGGPFRVSGSIVLVSLTK
jgi:hypothetical protein